MPTDAAPRNRWTAARLTAREHAQLVAAAARRGCSISDLVRDAIERDLEPVTTNGRHAQEES